MTAITELDILFVNRDGDLENMCGQIQSGVYTVVSVKLLRKVLEEILSIEKNIYPEKEDNDFNIQKIKKAFVGILNEEQREAD